MAKNTGPLGGRPIGAFSGVSLAGLPADRIALASEDGDLIVVALAGDKPAVPTAGYGGWENVALPKKEAVPVWRGRDTSRIDFNIILDGLADDQSVEDDCSRLSVMAGGGPDAGDTEPPKLYVTGRTFPVEWRVAPGVRWVIAELAWGELTRRESDGHRVRQVVDLGILRWGESESLKRIKPRKLAPNYKLVSAREGDTFATVAKAHLGSSRLGKKLAALNDERDPTKRFPKARTVRLPTAHTLALWTRELRGR